MYKNFFKRFLDILISLIALPFILLAIIVMAPVIYINDPGPIFYNAERRGKDGKTFKMYKFRSMYVNSPDLKNADGSTYNGDDDPRVTRVGRIMRKLSIDEIPQILNVLKGDMSYVGPRPTLATRPYSEVPVEKRKRYLVRPGITGYAQAYYRNSITQQEKFKHDCYYIDNLTFIMDIKVLIQTVKSVLMRENIYVTAEITGENNLQKEKELQG
ncbi:MAG: sugar transferase [Clostridia bacterium]|nr:sugar transferase [Clostridia bacterium]